MTSQQMPKGTITRLQKLCAVSMAMLIVGIFAVQFKTVGSAMMAGAVSITGGVIFLLLAIQEWRAENAGKYEKPLKEMLNR